MKYKELDIAALLPIHHLRLQTPSKISSIIILTFLIVATQSSFIWGTANPSSNEKYYTEFNSFESQNTNDSLGSVPAKEKEVDFELGIRYELLLMFANLYNNASGLGKNALEFSNSPLNFHLTAGLRFINNYKIYLTGGLMVVYEDFLGFDGGIFFEASLYNPGPFGVIGVDFFNDSGEEHNLSSSGGNFTFYCIGAGYNFSKHFDIDLMYYVPNNKVFGSDLDFQTYQLHNKTDNGLLKLGFEYKFVF
jgi:hypothetical protein